MALTVSDLAKAKKFGEDFLADLGITTDTYKGEPRVRIPYPSVEGQETSVRYRHALSGASRFTWRSGSKTTLYGVDRLADAHKAGWVLIVEGESDCWTAWYHCLPAVGVPGKATWKPGWAEHLKGLEVFVWQEPDAEDFSARIFRDIPTARVIVAPEGIKDISEAHIAGEDVPELLERLKKDAPTAAEIERKRIQERLPELTQLAQPLLNSLDPIEDVRLAILGLGYGGDLKPPLIGYLAATSRLLVMRPGSMPVHLLLLGSPSAGKSWTVNTFKRLLPGESVHEVDAGSPRVLIYEEVDLRHKAIIFSEADSLPAGEDNPAASAVRNLLQEHRLRYSVTVRDPETGDFTVRTVDREGPSVLITTAVRPLGEQLLTRFFVVEVSGEQEQVRAALKSQANLELHGAQEPHESLVAFQTLLQALAPWDVYIPFVDVLAEEIGRHPAGSRVLRDYSRLVSLVKSVALLRHRRRASDEHSRIVATIADYALVYELLGETYESTVSGASARVRDVVDAVKALKDEGKKPIKGKDVADRLGITPMSCSRHMRRALAGGWLLNNGFKGRPLDLEPGDPLPERSGLPSAELLLERMDARNAITLLTDGYGLSGELAQRIEDGTDADDQGRRVVATETGEPDKAMDRAVAVIRAKFGDDVEEV